MYTYIYLYTQAQAGPRPRPQATDPLPHSSMKGMPGAFLTLVVGANRGIGLELCKQLHARGDQVGRCRLDRMLPSL